MGKWTDDAEPVPERLARYVEAEWPGDNPSGQFGDAAIGWLDANPGRELPWAADRLEVRQHVVELRKAGAKGPPLRSPWGRPPGDA